MLKQRCPNCRAFLNLESERCSCGISLSKSGRELWCWKKIDGKRHFKKLGRISKNEAELLHARWLTELVEAANPGPTSSDLTLKGSCEIYIEKLQAANKPYHKEARLFLGRLMQVCGDCNLIDVTVDMARGFQRRIVQSGASLAYADRHVAISKAMFNYAAPHLPNPFKQVKMFRPDNTLIRMLSEEQEKKLLAAAAALKTKNMPWLVEILMVALRTGLRRRDVLTLTWEQLDLQTRSIAVIQKGKRRLTVPMSADLAEMFRQMKKKSESVYVFPNSMTGKPYGHFNKTWVALKAAAGIPANFRFHDIRHHVATKLARNTRNPLVVQTILGHSSISTTQKYMHVWRDDLVDAVDSL